MVELVPSLLRQELDRLATEGQRIDGRGQFEGREVHLEVDCLYNAEGSAKVVWGDTIIYAGVKFEIRTPWPDRPTQGSLRQIEGIACDSAVHPVRYRCRHTAL